MPIVSANDKLFFYDDDENAEKDKDIADCNNGEIPLETTLAIIVIDSITFRILKKKKGAMRKLPEMLSTQRE